MIKKILLITCLTACSLSPAIANNQSMLSRLKDKIASIKSLIHRDSNKRGQLQSELRHYEIHTGRISKKLNKTNKALSNQQNLLATLQKNEENTEEKLNHQRDLLNKQIQTAYMLGRQPYLKLILNQKDSDQMSRVMMYYQYIEHSRITAISDLQNTLSQIDKNKQEIQTQYETLQGLQKKQLHEKNQLTTIKKNRQQLIKRINHKIQNKTQRLQRLVSDKHRLEATIDRLNQNAQGEHFGNFAHWRGKLSWPTRGKVLPIFGTQIEQSELRWGGVLIKARDGRPIHAVANGKVVFSKWLSGYGLLVIINHGNGYMTLYGRNTTLYKKAGDTVRKGDLIATVGQSGGYQTPALYFAIRHNSKPLNPTTWCR